VEPKAWPSSIPRKDVFQGDIIHSARGRGEIDLKDRDVIVIDFRCSAAQIVPSLLQMEVKTVTQVLRTPPWVSPKVDEPFGKGAYARYAPTVFRFFPVLGYTMRCIICPVTEILWWTVFQETMLDFAAWSRRTHSLTCAARSRRIPQDRDTRL
jgi:hypothetical protein